MDLTLTPAGNAKISKFLEAAKKSAQLAVQSATAGLRVDISRAAPGPEEEAIMLSRGLDARNRQTGGPGARGTSFGVGQVGTPEGDRFLREGMISLREAILLDPVTVSETGDLVVAGTGNPATINPRTGFSWRTRKRGVMGPTLPFDGRYVQAVENGGLIWIVVPRPGTKALEPEPGVISFMMYKSIPPQRMYKATLFLRQEQMRNQIFTAIRQASREAVA